MRVSTYAQRNAKVFKRGACTNAWAYRIEGEKEIFLEDNRPCLATILTDGSIKELGFAVRNVDPEFFHWLANESPLKHTFKTKSHLSARRAGVEMDMSAPLSHVFNAAVWLRQMWEREWFIELFKYFVSEGVSKESSAVLGCFFTKCWRDGYQDKYVLSGADPHHPFHFEISVEDVKDFKEGKLNNPEQNGLIKFKSVLPLKDVGAPVYNLLRDRDTKIGEGWESFRIIELDEVVKFAKENSL